MPMSDFMRFKGDPDNTRVNGTNCTEHGTILFGALLAVSFTSAFAPHLEELFGLCKQYHPRMNMCRWTVSGRQHVIMCLVCGWLEHLVPEFNSQKLKQLKEMASNSGDGKGANHIAKAVRYLKQRLRKKVPGANDQNKQRTGSITLSGPALKSLVVDVLTFSKDKVLKGGDKVLGNEAAGKWAEYGITLNCFSDANLIEVMKSMLSWATIGAEVYQRLWLRNGPVFDPPQALHLEHPPHAIKVQLANTRQQEAARSTAIVSCTSGMPKDNVSEVQIGAYAPPLPDLSTVLGGSTSDHPTPMPVVKTKNTNKGRLSTGDGAIINTERQELLVTPTSTAAKGEDCNTPELDLKPSPHVISPESVQLVKRAVNALEDMKDQLVEQANQIKDLKLHVHNYGKANLEATKQGNDHIKTSHEKTCEKLDALEKHADEHALNAQKNANEHALAAQKQADELARETQKQANELARETQKKANELARETQKKANELARVQLAASRAAHDASMQEQRATTDRLLQIDDKQLELMKKIDESAALEKQVSQLETDLENVKAKADRTDVQVEDLESKLAEKKKAKNALDEMVKGFQNFMKANLALDI